MPRYTDQQLIDSIKRTAEQLGHTPTMAEFRALDGTPDVLTVTRRLGSWRKALERAGLKATPKMKPHAYPDSELIEHLHRSARILGRAPRKGELATIEGFPNEVTYAKRFGSWKGALAQAGIGRRGRKPQYTDDELLAILVKVADKLGRAPTTVDLTQMKDAPSPASFSKRFGSWTAALDRAGIKKSKNTRARRPRYSDEQLIAHLKGAADRLGGTPRVQDLAGMEGVPSPLTYRNRFGSWSAALEKAGLEAARARKKRYDDEELLDLLRRAAKEQGRPPRSSELAGIKDLPSYNTFIGRFGTWQNALLAAGIIEGKRGMTLLTAEQRRVIAALDEGAKQLPEIAKDGNLTPDDAKVAVAALAKRGIVQKVKTGGKKARGPPRYATVDAKLNEVLDRETRVFNEPREDDVKGDEHADPLDLLVRRRSKE